MNKKHAMEYAKLLKEYEEGRQRDQEPEIVANKEVEVKDQGLKIKIEEILTLVKEMNREQKEKKEVKARRGDEHSKVHEVSHPSEPERMLKDCTEIATEELSRKKLELDDVKEKNGMIETQRNKKKSEAAEEVEKIKKKKNKKDDDFDESTLKRTTEGRIGGF